MEKALTRFLEPGVDPIDALATLAASLRPGWQSTDAAIERVEQLCTLLSARNDLRDGLRQALLHLFGTRHAVLLLATSGIYPETGLVSETLRRISHRILPEADDEAQLKDALARVLQRSDAFWLQAVPVKSWAALIRVLGFDGEQDSAALGRLTEDLLEALRIVAHRVAAAGLEPEMLRLDPSLEKHASPFLALCEEALELAKSVERGDDATICERHLMVLIDQASETIERVRRRAQVLGASFYLTFRLRRLAQHLRRLQELGEVAGALGRGEADVARTGVAILWVEMAVAECCRNDLRPFWRQNMELVALRVTENAGKSGEHYITERRSEQLAMLRSAAGGGLIIAFMAAHKIFLGTLGLAPLTQVLAYCLNYGLGFVLIHMLHYTVATKQPAMTANAIAAAIGDAQDRGRQRNLEPLVTLIARTVRTQFAAILGNVGLAVPTAMLFGYILFLLGGEHFISHDKAQYLLAELDPFTSGSLVFAAVAGVCLFLAGLIAGYYDNMSTYNRIPERLYQLQGPRRLFGADRWQRFTVYVGDNLGALAGNFFFGVLLGGAAGLGMLLGLPLDIRHIAFSSAYWGYAMVGLGFGAEWQMVTVAALGVLLIGLTNLAVSFYLALWIGLKARGVNFSQRMDLARAIGVRLLKRPREFFLAPAESTNPKNPP